MTDYIPTTEEVRRRYMFGCWQEYEDTSGDYKAEFDRWFDEVIRQAKAQAWEEGYNAKWVETYFEDNPYR